MESTTRAKGVAWAVIALLACGLCYSIGFQSGWIRGADTANQRWDTINQNLRENLFPSGEWPSAHAPGHSVVAPAG